MTSDTELQKRRHKPRREVEGRVDVIDCMTARVLGRVGNLSESGMLLLLNAPLRLGALYQLRFDLAAPGAEATTIEVGAQLLWQDPGAEGTWAGLHFIHLPPAQRKQLQAWIGHPAG